MKNLTLGLCLGGVFAAAAACGGGDKEPETPSTLVPTATATMAPTAAPMSTMAPAATAASTANPLAAVEPALAQAAQGVLAQAAAEEAPGTKGLDLPKVGLLGATQSFEQTVTMQSGKCYTVIGIGLPPVAELNVQILPVTAVPGLNAVLAQDQTTGPRAVLGKAPNCFQWALPVAGTVRVVTTVAAGTGLVATQVFEK
jgi:hypothetical protein